MKHDGLLLLVTTALTLGAVSISQAQQPLTEQALRGTWYVGGSRLEETMSFAADGEFSYGYVRRKKDGKDIPAATERSEGAYRFATSACTVGSAQGNLWVVRNADRCCFTAYVMGKTLVLDEVKGNSIVPNPLCQSKTLKRTAFVDPLEAEPRPVKR
jgi:hypothetical protein